MSIILRKDKISPLTFEELDGNFEFLTKFITDIRTGIETGESIPIDYIRSLFSGNLGIVYNVSTGSIAIDKSSAVTTVNGRSGDIQLTKDDILYSSDDIVEGNSNLYYTDQRAFDTIKQSLQLTAGLSRIDTDQTITIVPQNFNIRLTGAVTGSATVNQLNDVVINDGAGLHNEWLAVAMTGRVPVKVTGPVKKGQRVVTSDLPGVGKAIDNDNIVSLLSVVGRALENSNDDNIKLVECVVGKL